MQEITLKKQQPNVLAIATLSFALAAISFAPIFIRFAETELGANGTVFNRLLIFVVVFGVGKYFSPTAEPEDNPPEIKTHHWVLLSSVGLISIISLVLWAMSLQYTTVAKSMLLNNLTPIFTTLGSWLFFNKRFDSKFLLGMAIALAGAMGLGLEDLQNADGLLLGDILALLSAVFLGAYFLVVEKLRAYFDATTILLWRCAIGSVCLAPLVWLNEGQFFPETKLAIFAVLGLGIICEGFGQRLIASCMDQLSSSFVSIFLLLEPIVSALLAWAIFAEVCGPTTWIGFGVIMSGIYLAQSSGSAMHEA